MATSTHFAYVNVYTPSVPKYKAFGVFMIDYGCVEKSLLLLIIKYWNSIWVNKYMLIKVTCLFSMHLPYMHLSYMVACTSFCWKRSGNNAQLKWLDPLLIEDDLYLWTNFES